ncbi:MAG: IS5/IS1182 family transposase [uncultured Sulfurovum sp.]|uniref:IS5/IS1182 family transposase n=1 Tax=uncultured Sulfurovum sp. TaxID=269237 RepID=A0A6S6TGV3_9BACT|nr:MAG: IS5/IS1182 family transposase [uncultured Sulfurovum sp.]
MRKIIPSLSKMWLKVINLEQSLFPRLQESMGSLSPKEEKLIKILDFAQIEKFVYSIHITNPPKDREELARAFVAKQVYNIQTTRDLIERLKIDRTLRVICGWRHHNDIPSESKFSRVFKEFSQQCIASKAHDVFIESYLSQTIFFYSSIDSTAIELREKSVMYGKSKKEIKPKRRQGRPKKGEEGPPKKPSILQRQENMQSTEEMLSLISTKCDTSIKQNSKGNRHRWTGGKLHLSVVDGDIPITAIYSSASVHDSSLALPLIKESSQKVNYLYDLADAAYDTSIIKDYSKKHNHRPIIDINPKNSKKLKAKIALVKSEKQILKPLKLYNDSDDLHYNQRTSVERVNAYLKDSYGCSKIYYQGAQKVASVFAFAVLSVCITQSLKLIT